MSILNNSNAIPVKGGGYTIDQSLRFRSVASSYLSRTPASAGNRRTWTWSAWVKRGVIPTNYQTVFDATNSGNVYQVFRFIDYQFSITMDNTYGISTNAVFRDPSAWYHIVVVNDTTQATASNRVKIYVNGVQQSTYFWYGTYPSQNFEGNVNSANQHSFGRYIYGNTYYFDGHLTELNLIDGQALTPSDFGEYGEDTGAWQAKKYTGTYGTNGFYIDGTNNGSSTILDQSGNSNDWTSSGMTLGTSSSVNYALMTDVPTLTNEDTANFCTFNPLDQATMNTVNANLTSTNNSGGSWQSIRGTIGISSGKWYWEADAVYDTYLRIGVGLSTASLTSNYSNPTDSWTYVDINGNKTGNGSETGYGASYSDGDKIGVALDMDAGTLTFYKNGSSQGVAFNTGLSGKEVFPLFAGYNTSRGFSVNFGQRPFTYTPPTGYKKLNTYNLPDSAVLDGSQHFYPKLYTGTGSTLTVSGLEFSPDWIWFKQRGKADYHQAYDTVRGVAKNLSINQTVAEQNSGTVGLTAFNSDGFTIGTWNNLNQSGIATVAWCWRASDSSAVSNTDGTITTTVSANTDSGFSIVTFTGNGSANATTGHGLSQAPDLIIHKQRNGSKDWLVSGYGGSALSSVFTADNQFLLLNTNTSKLSASSNTLEAQATTIKHRVTGTNTSGNTFVMYCFHNVEGFSKFGSYTANGSTDGPFVYTGFRPAFVLMKNTSRSQEWILLDSSRDSYNVSDAYLRPESSNAEGSGANQIDILSNGFKIRTSGDGINYASGDNFIYMAFAENSFKNSLAR